MLALARLLVRRSLSRGDDLLPSQPRRLVLHHQRALVFGRGQVLLPRRLLGGEISKIVDDNLLVVVVMGNLLNGVALEVVAVRPLPTAKGLNGEDEMGARDKDRAVLVLPEMALTRVHGADKGEEIVTEPDRQVTQTDLGEHDRPRGVNLTEIERDLRGKERPGVRNLGEDRRRVEQPTVIGKPGHLEAPHRLQTASGLEADLAPPIASELGEVKTPGGSAIEPILCLMELLVIDCLLDLKTSCKDDSC